MKKYILLAVLLLPCVLFAQNISGTVTNTSNEPLMGASVYWSNTKRGTTTDSKGEFKLSTKDISPKILVVSYLGHISDTLEIVNESQVKIQLKESSNLDEIVVKSRQDGVIISSAHSIKTEHITQTELAKAACCDLAGCFETQTTVQPHTTNVITNSKELRMLGLSGVYSQVLIDGFPMIQGLSYTYGISSIPGTLVDNIYVSKGANSVLQGYESISGQINVETKKPDETDKLFLNAYINSFAEKQFNLNYAVKNEKWSNLTAAHVVQPGNDFDRDDDNFLDVTKLTRYMVFNKLKYGNETDLGWNSEIGLRFVNEKRVGGQVGFDEKIDKGSSTVYGQSVSLNQPEIWTKNGFRINDKHNLTLYASGLYQDQNSYFGTVKYDAKQSSFNGNLQYDYQYGENSLKTGVSYRHLSLDETIGFTDNALQRTYAGDYDKQENIVGAFAENSLSLFEDKLTWITGVRLDNHNQFGTRFTPRTFLKYDVTPSTVIRANIGTGWRTVNLFSENIGLLVSSRDIVFAEQLEPEKAWNTGINLTQNINSGIASGFFSVDYYRTDFQNQIFPDFDTDPTKVIIDNFNGKSVSNTFQAEVFLNFWNQLEFKTGYSFIDVYRVVEGEKESLPFNSKHRVVTNLGFKPLSDKFRMDMNIQWNGKQRLPDTKSNPIAYQRPDYSESYALLNAQFTYNLKDLEFYTGVENIFDFRQKQPIIGWEDPFGQYFDTSSVWGPTQGRELYLGIRYRIPSS